MLDKENNNPGSLISICMPAYNAARYVAEAIQSVIRQTYPNWELIIVNDGSTDDTANVVGGFSDPRIKIYHQENRGQCAAANRAFQLSSGQYIKFFDADDLLSERCLETQIAVLKGGEHAIAYSDWGRFYNDDMNTFTLNKDWLREDIHPFEWLIKSMTDKQVMLQCAIWLIPRKILEKSGLWNEKLSLINDFEFIIRVLLCAEQLHFADGATLYYRSGVTGSLSGTTSAKGALSAYNSVDWGTQHLLDFRDTPEVRKISANCFQQLVYSFYPGHKELVNKAETRISELGGADAPFPAGGVTKKLSDLFGWKATQKFKHLTGRR